MVCAKCGRKNTRTAKYCGRCGHPFSRAAEKFRPSNAAGGGTAEAAPPRVISFDFGPTDSVGGGPLNFGEPSRREKNPRLRESYISMLEKSLPETLGVFTPGEAASEERSPGGWADVTAPPSTPWALEHEFQTAGGGERWGAEAFAERAAPGQELTGDGAEAGTSEGGDEDAGRLVGWLVTFSHSPEGEDFRLYAGRVLIGTHPKCHVLIRDESVSAVHASITYDAGRCHVRDERSGGGTFVNDAAVDEARPLESYDEIRVGQTVLKFVAVDPAAHKRQAALAAD
jgi:hypothetical protein